MTTIVLERPGVLAYAKDSTARDPGPGEALVRVRAVGVCGTDFHAFGGRQPFFTYPRILGHEVSVEVVQLGAGVSGIRPGDRCAIEPYVECGACIACRRGRPNCCERLSVLGVHADGGMREHFVVPARKLHRSVRLDAGQLALVETLGIGAHAVARAQLSATDTVLVVGSGPI
nr:alcohol dehydrogenase catalytic domain-containing protein [Planctomycetota bacterium]